MAVRWYEQSGSGRGSIPEPQHLIIGRVTRPHGIRGEVRVEIHTDQPDRYFQLKRILVGEQELASMTIESVRYHQNIVIIKFSNYDTRTQAEGLKGKELLIPIEEAIPLDQDEYFLYQLIGLEVQTQEKLVLGEIVDIIETGANDVFVVDGPLGQILLPDTPEVILDVDLEGGIVLVHLLPGLRDE